MFRGQGRQGSSARRLCKQAVVANYWLTSAKNALLNDDKQALDADLSLLLDTRQPASQIDICRDGTVPTMHAITENFAKSCQDRALLYTKMFAFRLRGRANNSIYIKKSPSTSIITIRCCSVIARYNTSLSDFCYDVEARTGNSLGRNIDLRLRITQVLLKYDYIDQSTS